MNWEVFITCAVTGAGDTVIATLSLMVAAGADLHAAMRVANHAAGIVVGKLGTAVVHRDELDPQRHGEDAPHDLLHRRPLVVDRHDHGEQRVGERRAPRRRPHSASRRAR